MEQLRRGDGDRDRSPPRRLANNIDGNHHAAPMQGGRRRAANAPVGGAVQVQASAPTQAARLAAGSMAPRGKTSIIVRVSAAEESL